MQREIEFDYKNVSPVMSFINKSINVIRAKGNVDTDDIIIAMPNYLSMALELHFFNFDKRDCNYDIMQQTFNKFKSYNQQRKEDCGVMLFGVIVFDDHFKNEIVVWYKDSVKRNRPDLIFTFELSAL